MKVYKARPRLYSHNKFATMASVRPHLEGRMLEGYNGVTCSLYRTTDTTVNYAASYTVSWEGEYWDSDNFWSSGTLFTIPYDGIYAFSAWAHWANDVAAERETRIYVNGSVIAANGEYSLDIGRFTAFAAQRCYAGETGYMWVSNYSSDTNPSDLGTAIIEIARLGR